MGSQLGPRLPQSSNTLLAIDPGNSRNITNAYTNLYTLPENFSGAVTFIGPGTTNIWYTSQASVIPNQRTAPNGTNTASLLVDTVDGSNSTHSIRQQYNHSVGETVTVSIFAKANTFSNITFVMSTPNFADGIERGVNFNLLTGQTSYTTAATPGVSMVSVGDGWWRCAMTYTSTLAALNGVQIRPSNGTTSFYTGNGSGSVLIWGAMLNPGSTLLEYIPQSVISNANQLTIITNPLSTVSTSSSILSNTIQDQVEYTTPGTYSWLCPAGVTSVSVVAVGGGGGGGFGDAFGAGGAGGNLRYVNNIPVVPGLSYQVIVGAGGAVGGAGQTSRPGGTTIFGGNLVVASGGGGGGTAAGTPTSSSNVGIGSDGGFGGINSDGGGGGAGGYIPQPANAGVLQVSANQFDATSLGAVASIDVIGAHPTASILPAAGFLKYFIAKASGPQEVTVSFRKTGATLSQSAFTTEGGTLAYTSSISSILFYGNDDHDTMFVDADGRGMIYRVNNNGLNAGNFDKFRGAQEVILNQPIDNVATYNQSSIISASGTIVSFPLTTSSITFNFINSTYKVNNGSILSLPTPLNGISAGGTSPVNSIWTISDGVNQFLIGRYGNTTSYLVTVDLTTNTVSASSFILTTSPSQTNTTEEDAIGTQLFTVDGVANWCSGTIYYYGGTADWKINNNIFNTSGRLVFSAGSVNTQTDMDIWGSIDANGYLWFADWGHDDGGLFNVGNDSQLGTRQTNIRYVPTFASANLSGSGGGRGGGNFASQPSAGIGGAGGGGGSGSGAAGGGGVGIYGYTNDGAAGTTRSNGVNGIQQGGGGSGGQGGATKNVNADLAVQTGGLYGGGGGGGFGAGPGGGGAVRIMWGQNRSFPFTAVNVDPAYGSSSSAISLTPVATLNSASYENGYLSFTGATSSYATISNVPNSDYLTVNAAVFLSNWTSATGTFVSNADTDGTTRYQLGINNASYSGQVGAIFRTRLGNLVVGFSRSGITAGWHMLTATFDGSAARLYIDGVLVATTSAASATLLENVRSNTMTIAARLSSTTVSEAIACRIGNLSLLNQAYSASDVFGQYSSIRGRYGI